MIMGYASLAIYLVKLAVMEVPAALVKMVLFANLLIHPAFLLTATMNRMLMFPTHALVHVWLALDYQLTVRNAKNLRRFWLTIHAFYVMISSKGAAIALKHLASSVTPLTIS